MAAAALSNADVYPCRNTHTCGFRTPCKKTKKQRRKTEDVKFFVRHTVN